MDDYEAIRQLFAEYAQAMDRGAADELAALFEPEGSFDLLGHSLSGREAIAAMVRRYGDAGVLRGGKHVTVNSVIRVEGNIATARSDWFVLKPANLGWSVSAAGEYDDELVKSDRWRFRRRIDRVAGQVPEAAFAGAGDRPASPEF